VNRWFFLRHGESEANRARVFSGHHDVPLTSLGREQASKAGLEIQELLNGTKLSSVWSSDLQRARETADRALQAAQINIPVHTHSALRERHLGEWQGQSIDALKASGSRDILHAWTGAAPGGESLAALSVRATELLATVHPSGPILLVGHGGLIRVLLGLIDDTPTDQIGKLNIPNAVPIERTIADGRWGKILSALTR
jgi:broad specificity phosphatase PhoE